MCVLLVGDDSRDHTGMNLYITCFLPVSCRDWYLTHVRFSFTVANSNSDISVCGVC